MVSFTFNERERREPLRKRKEEGTHLETLRVPPLDLLDAGHLVQTVGKLVELLDAVCEADRELCGEKLGRPEEGALDDGVSSALARASAEGRREGRTCEGF